MLSYFNFCFIIFKKTTWTEVTGTEEEATTVAVTEEDVAEVVTTGGITERYPAIVYDIKGSFYFPITEGKWRTSLHIPCLAQRKYALMAFYFPLFLGIASASTQKYT